MFTPLKHQPRRTTSARTPRARCRPWADGKIVAAGYPDFTVVRSNVHLPA